MAEELLEKIPAEKCWAITSKTLWRFMVLRGDKTVAPELSKGEGIIAPVLGAEKWLEIHEKLRTEGGKQFYPSVKETFNILVEDAIGACKLSYVVAKLAFGPGIKYDIVEKTPKRIVSRLINCPCWESYEEFKVNHELRPCEIACELFTVEGLKAINPKLSFRFDKTLKSGDPYCESIIEFKDE